MNVVKVGDKIRNKSWAKHQYIKILCKGTDSVFCSDEDRHESTWPISDIYSDRWEYYQEPKFRVPPYGLAEHSKGCTCGSDHLVSLELTNTGLVAVRLNDKQPLKIVLKNIQPLVTDDLIGTTEMEAELWVEVPKE